MPIEARLRLPLLAVSVNGLGLVADIRMVLMSVACGLEEDWERGTGRGVVPTLVGALEGQGEIVGEAFIFVLLWH